MPFKSESQHRLFRVLLKQGKISQKTFDQWMDETRQQADNKAHPIKGLPERVKTAMFRLGFHKVAGGPGSGVSHPNTEKITILEGSPLISVGKKSEFLRKRTPERMGDDVKVSRIRYKGQDKMVPKKVISIMTDWDKVKNMPVELIEDDNGDFHIIDGHHRALAAILMRLDTIKANIYRV